MASGALTAGNRGVSADGVRASGAMPMRPRRRIPAIRSLRSMHDMQVIALFVRLSEFRFVGMTHTERTVWEKRMRSVYKECLRRFVPPEHREYWTYNTFGIRALGL